MFQETRVKLWFEQNLRREETWVKSVCSILNVSTTVEAHYTYFEYQNLEKNRPKGDKSQEVKGLTAANVHIALDLIFTFPS